MARTVRQGLVYASVLLLAAIVPAAGCTRVGTAGVSTTAEESPITVASTQPAVAATLQEQQRLEHARDVLQAQQTGTKLFIGTPLAEDYVNESRLIVHGRVTELHPLFPEESAAPNSYVGIWVEADEVLKGSLQDDGPAAFVLLAPAQGEYESPLAVGDEVLCFSYRVQEGLHSALGIPEGYFFWNDSYGIFLPVGDKFVNVLSPFASTSLDEVRTLVGPKTTSTTLPPGYLPFDGKAWRFEDRLTNEALPGTLPYEILASADLDWLPEAIAPVEMTIAKGYRLDNGDLVFLWQTSSSGASFEEREPTVIQGLETAARERYGVSDKQVWAFWFGEFGYLVVATDNLAALGALAQMAQTGQPLD
jgi:hypothetical protein